MRGITLLEIIMVVAILISLSAAAIPIFGNLQPATQLNEEVSQIIQTLRIAQVRSVARLNNSAHGVFFEINPGPDRFILYQGPDFSFRNSNFDRIIKLSDSLSFSTQLSSTGTDVNFAKGVGTSSTTGLITVTSGISGSKIIKINAAGSIEKE